MQVFSWSLINAIITIGISAYLFTWFLQKAGGWYLRRKSAARRSSILARVKVEEAQMQSSPSQSPETDDGEWEKVEKNAISSAPNGKAASKDWEGLIGFFHPFWFVACLIIRSEAS